ncbi:MAG: glycoside hydrolase family 172 protein [Rhodothermales bacterium]
MKTHRLPLILLVLAFGAGPALAQITESPLYELARIKDGVKSKRISSFDTTGGNNDRLEHIANGERRTLFDVQGAGMIDHIWITIAPPPPTLSRNDIILRMYWDGSDEPCVESPIGPFFGQGWNESYDYASLPLAAGPRNGRAMVSYFVMPFANGARIEVENDTGRDIDAFYYYVDYVEMDELPADMGRFHAWYNHELTEALPGGENEWSLLGPQDKNTDGARNYLFADLEGHGHFVGVNYFVHSPSPMWYGEGDDMIFIDGEPWPPSLHGTGTEDYFNTSWSPKDLFHHPYYGYARVNDDVGWLGRTHVYRFNISDPIYFDKSLRFTIEHGHNDNLTLDLSSVAYWYQKDPHKPFPPLPDRAARADKPFIGVVDMHRWRDAWRKSMGGGATLWGNEK